MNYLDMLPEEIVDKVYFEAHKTIMSKVFKQVIQRGLERGLDLQLPQLRPIKWTFNNGIRNNHLFGTYDGYDVAHLSRDGCIAMTQDVLEIFKADWKRDLLRQYAEDTGGEYILFFRLWPSNPLFIY